VKNRSVFILSILVLVVALIGSVMIGSHFGVDKLESQRIVQIQTQDVVDSLNTELDGVMQELDSLVSRMAETDTVYAAPIIRYIYETKTDTIRIKDTILVQRELEFTIDPQIFSFKAVKPDSYVVN